MLSNDFNNSMWKISKLGADLLFLPEKGSKFGFRNIVLRLKNRDERIKKILSL